MIFCASRTIAATLIELLTQPEELPKAQAEFKERTGGGIGGTKWRAPLLQPDIKPPIHFPWPEYIHTVRGEEWWIPTAEEDQS
jgi:aminobenzoyl-glutamate utilization protein B